MKKEKKRIIEFSEFFHPEFEGWLGEQDKGVYISYIQSKEKGKGHFSKLLEELKQKYDWIKVPTPFPLMEAICLSKGFIKTIEWFPEPFNEYGDIMYWEKPKGVVGK